jgi:hypothetical protein
VKPYLNIVAPRFLDWVEYLSPLGKGGDGVAGIANMTVGFLIVSAEPMDPVDENHEVIHIWQTIEVGAVGLAVACAVLGVLGAPWWAFALAALQAWFPGVGWFGLAYGATYLYWLLRLRRSPGDWTGFHAYTLIPFEREAYLYDQDLDYLPRRPWFAWRNIGPQEAASGEVTWAKHILATILTLRADT